jgi:hypothetical protein
VGIHVFTPEHQTMKTWTFGSSLVEAKIQGAPILRDRV